MLTCMHCTDMITMGCCYKECGDRERGHLHVLLQLAELRAHLPRGDEAGGIAIDRARTGLWAAQY
jgi:hypothetical protein